MYDHFLTFIKAEKLLPRPKRILLALSGGVDSMVMADLFLQMNVELGVAHVNYHLRGKESDMDQALVEKWCRKNKKGCHVHHVDPAEYETSESVQMVARRIRYDFFDKIIEAEGYDVVATAHNADDNLETVLLNLTKGTGIHGLIGIAPKKGNMIRPLLFASKAEVYGFAKSHLLEWREDKSNKKIDYQRNRIRNHVIPELEKINPGLRKTFSDTLLRLKGTDSVLEKKAAEILKTSKTIDGVVTIPVNWVDSSSSSLVLLSEVLRPYDPQFSQVKDLHQSILSSAIGAVFTTAEYQINVDRKRLIVRSIPDDPTVTYEVHPDTYVINMKQGELTFDVVEGRDFTRGDHSVAWFDYAMIEFPLKLRGWQEGDAFQPLGMKGKKKVSDFMIDSKIPVTLKQEVMILECGGEIAWLVGLRTDDRYKVTPTTTRMLKVQFNRHV